MRSTRPGCVFEHGEVDVDTNLAGCYWRVPDADRLHREAVEAGVIPPSQPADRPWRMREFHLVDRSGNLLRIGHEISAQPAS